MNNVRIWRVFFQILTQLQSNKWYAIRIFFFFFAQAPRWDYYIRLKYYIGINFIKDPNFEFKN